MVKAVQERVRRNSKRSIQKLAKDMDVSNTTMRTTIKTDLQLSPYKLRKHQALTTLQKQKRLDRAKILVRELKTGMAAAKIIFSNEKVFTVETKFNSQNNRVLTKCPQDIPDFLRTVYHCQKPSSVMV